MSPYSQGLLGLLDAGQSSPQRRPVRQGNYNIVQGSVDDGTAYVPYGSLNWAGLPGSESFIKPAGGDGQNYEEAGINTQAFLDYMAQNGYTFQEDQMGRDASGDSAFTRYAIDRDGNPVEATRVNGSDESTGNMFRRAAKLAAVMGTAYLGGVGLEGLAGGAGASAGAGSLTAGITPEAVAAFEAGLPSAAGSLTAAGAGAAELGGAAAADFGIGGGAMHLTPAAMEAGLGTAGYGYNAGAAASGMFNPATIGAGAGLTFGPGAGGASAGTSLTKLATDAAGNLGGRAIGGLLGAASGVANSGDKTQTSQQRLDPRMEAMLYGADGKSGYLGAATDWFNQNKGGNPLMLQGAQMMADHYRSPQYTQGYNAMRDAGLGLLGTPRAGNPFTRGG